MHENQANIFSVPQHQPAAAKLRLPKRDYGDEADRNPNKKPKTVCDKCYGMSHRRETEKKKPGKCCGCGKPYAPEVIRLHQVSKKTSNWDRL
jgi:hypothetical protein